MYVFKDKKSFKTHLEWQANCLSFVVNELQMHAFTIFLKYSNDKSVTTKKLRLKSAPFFLSWFKWSPSPFHYSLESLIKKPQAILWVKALSLPALISVLVH